MSRALGPESRMGLVPDRDDERGEGGRIELSRTGQKRGKLVGSRRIEEVGPVADPVSDREDSDVDADPVPKRGDKGDREQAPVKMASHRSDEGELGIPAGQSICLPMATLEKASFRDYCGRFIYLNSPGSFSEMRSKDGSEHESDGFVAFVYLVPGGVLTFRVCCMAKIVGGQFRFTALPEHLIIDLTFDKVRFLFFIDLTSMGLDFSNCNGVEVKRRLTMRHAKRRERVRMVEALDPFRSKTAPDVLKVRLYSKHLLYEAVQVESMERRHRVFFGRVLEEPEDDHGLHKGDIIPFELWQSENGDLLLISTDRMRLVHARSVARIAARFAKEM